MVAFRMPTTFRLSAAGKSDIGLVRSNNEDNLGFDSRHAIFVVCDGMGGQAAGEQASKIAVDTVLQYFSRPKREEERRDASVAYEGVSELANELGRAVHLANEQIHHHAEQNPAQQGMGTTLVAVAIEGERFSIANVGDSRIYLIRQGSIEQLTNDHSLVMEQVRRGILSLDEAQRSNLQNVIVRALGMDEGLEPDLADHELRLGDLLLLCSDGLTRKLSDDAILEVVTATKNLETACDNLIQAAKESGSDDNITCLLVRADQPSWKDRVFGPSRQALGSL
jgi:protein phosphatase